MTFRIFDTAGDFNWKKPCKNAIDVTPEDSHWKEWEVEINSLDALMFLRDEVKNELIIRTDTIDEKPVIEIYNDYRE